MSLSYTKGKRNLKPAASGAGIRYWRRLIVFALACLWQAAVCAQVPQQSETGFWAARQENLLSASDPCPLVAAQVKHFEHSWGSVGPAKATVSPPLLRYQVLPIKEIGANCVKAIPVASVPLWLLYCVLRE